MIDITKYTAPKSDQLNADDLIGRTLTIKITRVTECSDEQHIAVYFDGDNGKPWKPCKSMLRVLVTIWGKFATEYAGRSLTLYRDEKVKFGGLEVGGIRISHMSNMTEPKTMALTASKASRKPYTVKPLVVASTTATSATDALKTEAEDAAAHGLVALQSFWARLTNPQKATIKPMMETLKGVAAIADEEDGAVDDPFPPPPVPEQSTVNGAAQ